MASAPKRKEFDFSKYASRKIALKIAYLGWDYDGFVVQDHTQKTIEHDLFAALLKTKLVKSRETSDYCRCGRTDKGVSSYGQVVSLMVRSKLSEREQQDKSITVLGEMNYLEMLNRVLPSHIRALAWAPVTAEFSARFNCNMREYRYYFPKGNLDIEPMRIACGHLIGEHDFRNFCKLDVNNGVTEFVRSIASAEITECEPSHVPNSSYALYHLIIRGKAFLWHQIRCIVSVLFMVGESKEQPSIIESLLDVTGTPSKPQYCMAADFPLNLYDTQFDDLSFYYDSDTNKRVIEHFQKLWAQYTIRGAMLRDMLRELEDQRLSQRRVESQSVNLIPGNRPKVYKRLMDRPTCDDLETKIEKLSKKKRLKLE